MGQGGAAKNGKEILGAHPPQRSEAEAEASAQPERTKKSQITARAACEVGSVLSSEEVLLCDPTGI